MEVVVAGASGLIGSALVDHLRSRGHAVRRLVRRAARSADEIAWDPDAGRLDPEDLRSADAVVNLGGAGVGDRRWTTAYRRTILTSRTRPTALLATTLAGLPDGPRRLVQGTAVGYYGDRGQEELTERSRPGTDFLATVVQAWEAATRPAEEAGVEVVHVRTGFVLSRGGGAFGRLLPLLRLGVGGPLGPGTNVWPWITLVDEVRALEHLLTSDLTGPVNAAAPEPAQQREIIRAVAHALGRPAVVRVPRFALRVAVGGLADDILASQRSVPEALLADGFRFTHPDLTSAAAWVAGRD